MARGKPLCVGPTAHLKEEMSWEKLAWGVLDGRRNKGEVGRGADDPGAGHPWNQGRAARSAATVG